MSYVQQYGVEDKLRKVSGKPPKYLMYAGTDNGFTAAYRAYFGLTDGKIRKMTGLRYTLLEFGYNSRYERVRDKKYYFDVTAESDDPGSWFYKPGSTNEPYSMEKLTDLLRRSKINLRGDLFVIITEFDDYQIVDVRMEGVSSTPMDVRLNKHNNYAMFKGGRRMRIPLRVKLGNLRVIYRFRDE